ncbi:hypothetical protein NESM_000329900 [Novymonas esmeraldas]|uniref:Uncharacterized protein n=1 Tax=Novymonas esmeraldas TaxID=1808958 RepID=A0AAW0EJA7_9TRYP
MINDVVVHLTDAAFTSRVTFADAYVLPTAGAATTAPGDDAAPPSLPTAALVSPWLLTGPSTSTAAPTLESVPLAWRCPSCGTLEVEQLYWTRRQHQPHASLAGTGAAVRAAVARGGGGGGLKALSPALQAKVERHRRRRQRREEVRWRSLQVSPRCHRCFLCPRCGGHGSVPATALPGVTAASTQSTSALDIRITADVHYYAVCGCCQWHSYRAFASMERLLVYLDATMGDGKAEALREWRAAQRSANAAVRTGLAALLDRHARAGGEAVDVAAVPEPTLSQSAWQRWRLLRSAPLHQPVAGRSSRTPPPSAPDGHHQQQQQHRLHPPERTGAAADDLLLLQLHPALALERLRAEERQRREDSSAVSPLHGARQGAPQMMLVADAARGAAAEFSAWSAEAAERARGGLDESSRGHPAAIAPGARSDTEVELIARTQRRYLGLPAPLVDTRTQTVHTWMQNYQPAAVVAQQRRAHAMSATSPATTAAAAASLPPPHPATPAKALATPLKHVYATPTGSGAPAAAVTSSSALMHTPTSGYLQSILRDEPDRPLGLPAYCIPRGFKEILVGLVWRLPPQPPAAERCGAGASAQGCTSAASPRLVLLDRPTLSDAEVRLVCSHWDSKRTELAARRGQAPPQRQRRATEDGSGSDEDAEATLAREEGEEEEDEADGDDGEVAAPAPLRTAAAGHRKASSSSSTLPPPLFIDGTRLGALSCLPYVECVPDAAGGAACRGVVGRTFRLVNLHVLHDIYLTKLNVVQAHRTTSSTAEAVVVARLTAPSLAAVAPPLVLAPRCTPAERAAAAAATAAEGVAEDAVSGGVPHGLFAGVADAPAPPRLTELLLTVVSTAAAQSSATPMRYVALEVEVLTALPSWVQGRGLQYHAVRFGLTLTHCPGG